jgi:hypothetical protein
VGAHLESIMLHSSLNPSDNILIGCLDPSPDEILQMTLDMECKGNAAKRQSRAYSIERLELLTWAILVHAPGESLVTHGTDQSHLE